MWRGTTGPATARFGLVAALVALATTALTGSLTGAAVAERAPADGARGARVPGCTITGTPGPDVLVGTAGRDVICGLGGDDRLLGGGGSDVLRGGPGNDVLHGGSGNDVLRGDGGDDELRGGSGDDELYASAGDDDASGGEGNDVVRGGTGDDRLSGGPGRDTMRARDDASDRDVVACGAGEHDRAFADTQDVVGRNCENSSQNNPPVAVDDSVTATEDTRLDLPLAGGGSPVANDHDPDGDALTIVSIDGAVGGTVAIAGGAIHFTPTANLCGPTAGRFDYTITDGRGGSDVGRVTVAITCTPDDPSATDDAAMVPEDAAATPLLVLANDQDPDGDALDIHSVTPAGHGTVVITGGGTGLTYAPDPGYCNEGGARDTFSYTLTPGGSTATVTVLVLCVDDDPTAVNDFATVLQDASATAVDVLANDTDIDGGPKTIASSTDPAHGTVVLTGGSAGAHAGLTYEPDASYCNNPPGTTPDTFTYTLNGGSTATVSITVTCPNAPPTAVGDTLTVTEDDPATAIDVLADDTDTDGGPKAIASASDPAHGTVVLTGGSAGAHTGLSYQPAANYCNNPPGTTLDTFTYTLNGGSVATVTVTVNCVDDDPAAVNDTDILTEDDPATAIDVLGNDTDVDGGVMTIASASDPADGTVVLTGGSAGAHTGLTYEPNPDYCNDPPGTSPDTFTYTLNGGSSATVSVRVTCVADSPTVTTSVGPATYTENGTPLLIDSGVTVENPDGAAITGGEVSITGGFQSGQDVLDWTDDDLSDSITEGASTAQTIVLTGNGTAAEYAEALHAVNYVDTSDDPSAAARTVTFSVDAGSDTPSDTIALDVVPVDDDPVAVNDSETVQEDPGPTAVPVLANDNDVDLGPRTIASATDPAHGTVVLTGGSAGAHTGLTYEPDPDYCNDPPGTTPDTFGYTLNGGSSATVSITVTCVDDAPADTGESQDATGNTRLEVELTSGSSNPTRTSATGDLLDNATDVDDPHSALSVDQSTVSDPPHGVVNVNADGSYAYTPDPGYTGTDSFTYQVEDADGALSAPSTVSITVAHRIWYVRADAPAGGDGRSETPFNTLTAADTAATATGDTLYVFRRSGDGGTVSDSSLDLLAGQQLLGSAVDLVDGSAHLYDGNTGLRPSLTGTSVKLDDANVVRGLAISGNGAGAPAVVGAAGDDSGTLDQLNLSGTAGGLALASTTGIFNVSDLTVSTTGGTGVLLTSAGTVVFDPASQVSITSAFGPGLVASGTALGTSGFDSITVTGSGTGAVSLSSTTGTTTFGDLSLTTTSGPTGAFVLNNAGSVTVPDLVSASVNASGGPAVDVTASTNPSLSFDTVKSTNSSGDGVNLSGLGTGTFSAGSSSSITGVSAVGGVGFDLDGGSGNVAYAGTITTSGSGRSVDVTNRTGSATVDFTGLVTDNGAGLNVSGNSSGSLIGFTGGLVASTGANTAFNATGGTVTVTDANGVGTVPDNTLTTTTGRALNVSGATIGGAGLTFKSIASNGAPNGIVLSNTGSSGLFQVTGTGVSPSGGTIASSTGPGIALTNVGGGASFDGVNVTGGNDDGMNASTVTNLAVTDSTFTDNGDSFGGGVEDRGLDWLNVTGTATILRTTVSGAEDSNAHIRNTSSGATTLTVNQSTFTNSQHNAGLRIRGEGSSTMNATVKNSTFSLNADPGFSLQTDSANTAHQTLLFDNNVVSGGSANAVSDRPEVSINTDSGAVAKVTISNNHLKSAAGSEIILNSGAAQTGGGSLDAMVIGNTINDSQPGVLDPLADGGSSIWGWAHGNGATRIEVRNNLVQNWGGRALELSHNDGNGTADYTVTGNTINTPDVSANTAEGAYIFSGAEDGDASDVCVDLANNDMDGIGRQGAPDILIARATGTFLRFAGFNDTSVPNLRANLIARNAASPALTVSASGNGPTATADSACTLTSGTPTP